MLQVFSRLRDALILYVPPVFASIGEAGEFPRSAPPAFRSLFWFFLACAAAFLVYPAGWLLPPEPHILAGAMELLAAKGKPLFYGLALPPDRTMPLTGVAVLAAGNLSWQAAQAVWLAVSFCILLSGYGLGHMLAGRAAGVAAAAALFAGEIYGRDYFNIEQRFFCLLLLIVANALALRGYPERLKRLLEGLAVGLAFMARSSLSWFPLILAAMELKGAARKGRAASLGSAAIVLLVPFLCLLPWVRMNSAAGNGVKLFDGRADMNVVTGAMGIIQNVEGDFRNFAGLEKDESVYPWAVKRIVARPGDYLAGVGKRVAYIYSIHPLALTFWLVMTALLWRRPAFRRANLLGLYFTAVHLAFSSTQRYFIPILPVLLAIAWAGVFYVPEEKGEPDREGVFFAGLGAVPAAAAGLFCVFLLLRHPGAVTPERTAAVLAGAEKSNDSWLVLERGRSLLWNGDYPGAYKTISRAVMASPADLPARIDLALAGFLKNRRGRPGGGADMARFLPHGSGGLGSGRFGKEHVLAALYELDAGLPARAALSAELARQSYREHAHIRTPADAAKWGERGLAPETYVPETLLPELLAYFPPGLGERLGRAFLRGYWPPDRGVAKLDMAGIIGIMERRYGPKRGPAPDVARPSAVTAAPMALPATYDPEREVASDIENALRIARAGGKRVLMVVGGDWCSWCETMANFFKANPDLEKFRNENYVLLKVFHDPAHPPLPWALAGYPKIPGYPHIYVLDKDGSVFRSQDTTRLEYGSGYDREKFAAFLRECAPSGK